MLWAQILFRRWAGGAARADGLVAGAGLSIGHLPVTFQIRAVAALDAFRAAPGAANEHAGAIGKADVLAGHAGGSIRRSLRCLIANRSAKRSITFDALGKRLGKLWRASISDLASAITTASS